MGAEIVIYLSGSGVGIDYDIWSSPALTAWDGAQEAQFDLRSFFPNGNGRWSVPNNLDFIRICITQQGSVYPALSHAH